MKKIVIAFCSFLLLNCKQEKRNVPFVWENANVYFLLTDRFNNGDTSNDLNFDRNKKPAKLRGFEGGDFKGITQKIEEGYFTDLGVTAIWITPVVEQIHGATDEETGLTYGFHGYWPKDWTAIDPNFGTKEELKELVEKAHSKGIRVLLDAIINHTGPVTEKDPVWPKEWVRTEPNCIYDNYQNTVTCTLVKNLPDIKTESNENVALPKQLIEKWKKEGRYEQELQELEDFFKKTDYPRAPKYYIIKWLTDYITEFGIDGYRVDTAKHVEENIWSEFKRECDLAFNRYKKENPAKVLDKNDFFLVGEVYGYGISGGKYYDFGDRQVDYYNHGFKSLLNFEFKRNAKQLSKEQLFNKYDSVLRTELKGRSVLNYLSSHDDGQPFDSKRENTLDAGTILLLSSGASQIYYGDETARPLIIKGTQGDATLRSVMNWNDINTDELTNQTLQHYQKLGRFRSSHPAVGAGVHHTLSKTPYIFARTYKKDNYTDVVVVALDLQKGKKTLTVENYFKEGEVIRDAYSDQNFIVKNRRVVVNSEFSVVLLEKE